MAINVIVRCLNIIDTDQVMSGQPAITLLDFNLPITEMIDNLPKIDILIQLDLRNRLGFSLLKYKTLVA